MRVQAMKGGASGGTVASMVNLVAEAAHDRELRRLLADPYALAPPDLRVGPDQPDVVRPTRDAGTGQWLGPFVMAGVNTRVVHRSHALLGRPWGPDFRYREATATGAGPLGAVKAGGLTAGVAAGTGLLAIGPVRNAAARYVLPKPGEGPSAQAQERGFFDIRFRGTTADGRTIDTSVTGDRDPGYGSTAKMLGEAAVALVDLDPGRLDGGFWTPSTAFGDDLVERLEAHENPEAQTTAEVITGRCPLSVAVALELVRRSAVAPTVADVLAINQVLIVNFLRGTEFIEGVRAQLVDKDRNPQWRHAHVRDVTRDEVLEMFQAN